MTVSSFTGTTTTTTTTTTTITTTTTATYTATTTSVTTTTIEWNQKNLSGSRFSKRLICNILEIAKIIKLKVSGDVELDK